MLEAEGKFAVPLWVVLLCLCGALGVWANQMGDLGIFRVFMVQEEPETSPSTSSTEPLRVNDIDGSWVLSWKKDAADEYEATVKIEDGKGTLTVDVPFAVEQTLTEDRVGNARAELKGSIPLISGTQVIAPEFSPEKLLLDIENGKVFRQIGDGKIESWEPVKIVEEDGAMNNLRLQFLSGVEYRLKDRKTLLTKMIYKVQQSLEASITEEGIILKCSSPKIEGISHALSTYPPDLLLFKNQESEFGVWTKNNADVNSWRKLTVQSSAKP